MVKPLSSKQITGVRFSSSALNQNPPEEIGRVLVYNKAMEETVSYSFAVQIYRNESGTYTYGVFQEVESEEEDDLQLLEVGEADTINEAAEMVGRSLKTLFPA